LKVNWPVELQEFQVTTPTGIVETSSKVRIRGVGSITSGTDPLYVVMDLFRDNGSYTNANALGDMSNDIESFQILKMELQLQYGSRSKWCNLITTKKRKNRRRK
jgi:hypothetical protein